MKNNMIELISGACTSILWETIEDILVNEDSPTHVYEVIKTLHDCGKDKEAFAFVRVLYDITGLTLPAAIEQLDDNDDAHIRSAYISELLVDIENIL